MAGLLTTLPRSIHAGGIAHPMAGVPKIKAIAFDAFPIFDPSSIMTLAEQVVPGKGNALVAEWRTRQLEYCWLRALSRRYVDFWRVTQDALGVAANAVQVDLTADQQTQLMNAYLQLSPWSDVIPTLAGLQKLGVRLAILSNLTSQMLDANLKHARLDGVFEHVISTDRAKTYKPDVRAYQLAVDAFQLRKEEILFVAFAGWDAAGAKSFGFPTFWANRTNAPSEALGVEADGAADSLSPLPQFAAAIGS